MRDSTAQLERNVGVAGDPRWELVERIVASPCFVKSPRLCSFLIYICDLFLRGRADEINELNIGEALFDRPANYDPSADGIVRSHASRLRQRLDQYFSEEGAQEPIRLLIPKGGYMPVFEPHTLSTPQPETIPFPPAADPVTSTARRFRCQPTPTSVPSGFSAWRWPWPVSPSSIYWCHGPALDAGACSQTSVVGKTSLWSGSPHDDRSIGYGFDQFPNAHRKGSVPGRIFERRLPDPYQCSCRHNGGRN